MPVIEISSLSQPGLEMFGTLTEAQLRNRLEPEKGIFIAESPKVIRVALDAGCEPLALLCEQKHITGDAADIVARCAHVPVYTGPRQLFVQPDGLCADAGRALCHAASGGGESRGRMPRGPARGRHSWRDRHDEHRGHIPLGRRPGVSTPCCLPPTRATPSTAVRCVCLWVRCFLFLGRGSTFRWRGFDVWGLRLRQWPLTENSVPLDAPLLKRVPRLALVMGTEGDGLPRESIAEADYVVRIPMMHGVDSLNVAAASAVAFWELRTR